MSLHKTIGNVIKIKAIKGFVTGYTDKTIITKHFFCQIIKYIMKYCNINQIQSKGI